MTFFETGNVDEWKREVEDGLMKERGGRTKPRDVVSEHESRKVPQVASTSAELGYPALS